MDIRAAGIQHGPGPALRGAHDMQHGKDEPVIEALGEGIPQLGLGTWRLHGDALRGAVRAAFDAGCRHFDTATRYENEAELGAILRDLGQPRDALFVTTKVWHTDLAPADFRASAEASLKRLGLDHVDLLLIHWPNADIPLADTVGALCEVAERGLTRHIGVANFSPRLLEQAIALADRPIIANQCEYHPRLDQSALLDACRRNDVTFVAYSPLGSGGLIGDPAIAEIGRAHDRTPAQVILRWHMQQGIAAIPRSSNPDHVRGNFAIFDFQLSGPEMARLSALARADGRIISPEWMTSWD